MFMLKYLFQTDCESHTSKVSANLLYIVIFYRKKILYSSFFVAH